MAVCIRAVVLFLLAFGIFGSHALAQPTRPTQVWLAPGLIELRGINYTSNTPADPAQPAAGTATMVVTVSGMPEVQKPGVTFTNLVIAKQVGAVGHTQVTGISVPLDAPLTFPITDVPASTLVIPSGILTVRSAGSVELSGVATLTLPLRNSDGTPVTAEARGFRVVVTDGGGEFVLDAMSLKGVAAQQGLRLPPVTVRPHSFKYTAKWATGGPLSWSLLFPKVDVAMELPGLPAEQQTPLDAKADVASLTVDQDGQISFDRATVSARAAIKPVVVPGLEINSVSATVSMTAGVPRFESFACDITLPPYITDASGNAARVRVPNMDLSGEGPIAEIATNLDLRCGQLTLAVRNFTLDMSFSAKPQALDLPAAFALPVWRGIYFKDGDITLPVPGGPGVKLALKDFAIEGGGLSGLARTQMPRLTVQGFMLSDAIAELSLLRNKIVRGVIGGTIDIPGIGTLGGRFELSGNGPMGFAVDVSRQPDLGFPALGLKLRELRVRTEGQRLSLSGKMDFSPPTGLPLPPGLKLGNVSFSIAELQVDGAGKVYLPEGGRIDLPDPATIDLALFEAEVRSLAFTASGGVLKSVTFSGAGRLKGDLPNLPIGGEMDFEGFTIGAPERTGRLPTFDIGGLSISAEIPQVGELRASLGVATNVNGFESALYGGAEIKLTCLGEGGSIGGGGGLSFLVAPKEMAWFVGGRAEFVSSPVLVQVPATPTSPPVPLFHICGFAGGFGVNVEPVQPGIGPIITPIEQLKHSRGSVLFQAAMLVADPVIGAPGKVWWGDVTLTATLEPVTIDLTGRVAFMDVAGSPRWLDDSDFDLLDRRAKAYMNIDFERRRMLVGAEVDLCFPLREKQYNLLAFSGEGLLTLDSEGLVLAVGWEDSGQKPVKVQFAKAFEEKVVISGKMGMRVAVRGGASTAQLYMKAKADFSPSNIPLKMTMSGALDAKKLGTDDFEADGRLRFEGTADLELIQVEVDGRVRVRLNNDRMRLSGTARGSVGGLEQKVEFDVRLES